LFHTTSNSSTSAARERDRVHAAIHRPRAGSLHPRPQLTQYPLRIPRLPQQPNQRIEESIDRAGLPFSGYRVRVKYRPFGVRPSGGRHRQNADRRILAV